MKSQQLRGDLSTALCGVGCSLKITPNAVVRAPTNCEFKIAKHGRQQVVEVVRYATRHLTDNFHFLCLLKGGLGLPTFSDLLAQLLIRFFELAGPLPDQIFHLRRRSLTVEEVVLHLVLTPTSAQRRADTADQRNRIQRPLQHRNIAQASEQAQSVGMGSRRSGDDL